MSHLPSASTARQSNPVKAVAAVTGPSPRTQSRGRAPGGDEKVTGRNGDGNGCDGGSPQDFSYNGIGAGIEEPLGGIFTMTGNVNNNQAWTDDLLNVISAAVIPTVQCSTESAQHCILKKRETPAIARDCGDMDLNQCTMANFVQATIEDDSDFDCGTFLGVIGGAATAADVAPPVAGALALVQVFCDAFGGDS
ncbi:hypothetical protein LTR09_001546 [Extremus antarcticus]|uniref:Uncharacterized protein n=1 Tax=Extremus antarcticus TaxID=702011 RepID=A0AAJ0LW41_9PEZI|nr:hypothetical protein LTR09_001546 [Extremus antarcticus]